MDHEKIDEVVDLATRLAYEVMMKAHQHSETAVELADCFLLIHERMAAGSQLPAIWEINR